MTGRGRNTDKGGPSSRGSSAHSIHSHRSTQTRSTSRSSRASRAPSNATNAGSQASRKQRNKNRTRAVIVPPMTDAQKAKRVEVQQKMEKLINDITKRVSDEYVEKHINSKHRYDKEKGVVPYSDLEKQELLVKYKEMVAECDGHWDAAKKSDDYESMTSAEKTTFDNFWRSEKRKIVSAFLKEYHIPPLLNKQELRAYVQKIIMESQREMQEDSTKLDELKNRVFENLEKQVVVVRPETHVYERGKEPQSSNNIKDNSAMPTLLISENENRLGQQVLRALRYL